MDFVFTFYKCVYVTFHAWLKVIASVLPAFLAVSTVSHAVVRTSSRPQLQAHIHTERICTASETAQFLPLDTMSAMASFKEPSAFTPG
jgi:hypothetical protein